jgi:hypothetical protein
MQRVLLPSGPAVLRHLLCTSTGIPRTYGGAAGRAMAGGGGRPQHRGTRAEVEASPSADEILSGEPDDEAGRCALTNPYP